MERQRKGYRCIDSAEVEEGPRQHRPQTTSWTQEHEEVKRTEDGGRRTKDGGQRTEDRGRRTEDRGQRTYDGGWWTDDGGQMTDDES